LTNAGSGDDVTHLQAENAALLKSIQGGRDERKEGGRERKGKRGRGKSLGRDKRKK
jgi:hypothetical protein